MLAQAAVSIDPMREQLRKTPGPRPAKAKYESYGQAMHDRIEEIAPGTPRQDVILEENIPNNLGDLFTHPNEYAGNQFGYALKPDGSPDLKKPKHRLMINPNMDDSSLAHELGHIASRQTVPGGFVRKLRENPKLALAIGLASGALPLGAAALTPGDDDLNTAILGTYALAAPTLIDEALATKNGLNIMNRAGSRASLGQKGKLAGAYLTYMAAPLVAATGYNVIGNQFDENVPSAY